MLRTGNAAERPNSSTTAKDTKHAPDQAKTVLLRLRDEEEDSPVVIESPEQFEILPIRHAISAGLLQSRINGLPEDKNLP